MNTALAQSEIAQFLESSPQEVCALWERSALKRSIQVDQPSTPKLSQSSVFDVLEYYVRNEVLQGRDPGTEVEAWLCAVDELAESRDRDGQSFEEIVSDLIRIYFDFSGHPCTVREAAVRASQVLLAYFTLLGHAGRGGHQGCHRGAAC